MEKQDQDQYLLAEFRQGKEGAFDFVFRKYFKSLCAQANLYVHDLDKSQSLVQECFVKLWENRQKAESINNLSSYLSFMVRNNCIDYLRSVKTFDRVKTNIALNEPENNSEQLLELGEFEEKLVVALAMLPERSRQAFEYSRFDGLSYKEIAAKMDISVKAVEALLGRSLKILRAELKDYLPILATIFNMGEIL